MEDHYEFAAGFDQRVQKLDKFYKDENIPYELPKDIDDFLFYSGNDGFAYTLQNFFAREFKRGFKTGIEECLNTVDPQ